MNNISNYFDEASKKRDLSGDLNPESRRGKEKGYRRKFKN